MNKVAAEVPTKWRDIGLHLGLRRNDLDMFEVHHSGDCNRCFDCVFSTWEKKLTSPFTWLTIVQALRSRLVGEFRLAEEIKNSLIREKVISRYSMHINND